MRLEGDYFRANVSPLVSYVRAREYTHLVEHLSEHGQDRLQIDPRRDEVERHKVLHDGLVVAMDEVRNGLDHAELDVVAHLG